MTGRIAAILACILCSTPAFAQIGGAGGGIHPRQSQALTQIPNDQYVTETINWTAAPGATGSGVLLQQSTASGVTVTTRSPGLQITPAVTNKRCLIAQDLGAAGGQFTSAFGQDVTVSFWLYGWANCNLSNFWMQVSYGDTTNFKVSKVGSASTSSFGLVLTGSANANNAYAQSQRLTAYVVGAGADTTYTPLAVDPTVTDPMKIWMHSDAGGNVTFWVNDVLLATISSPTYAGVGTQGVAFWFNGDSTPAGAMTLGPVTIQRKLP